LRRRDERAQWYAMEEGQLRSFVPHWRQNLSVTAAWVPQEWQKTAEASRAGADSG